MISVDVRTTDPQTVAFLLMRGPYSQMPEALGRLYGWIAQHGLQPAGMPSGVYMTDPATVPPEQAVWEVRAPLAGDPPDAQPDSSGCGIKGVGPALVASTVYTGPYEEMAPVYADMEAWVRANGYELAGPPEEVYCSDPADTAPADYVTEIRMPVARV